MRVRGEYRFSDLVRDAGGPAIRPDEILRVTVGSEVHGVTVGSDDHDEMGIFVPGTRFITGTEDIEQYQWRSQPEGVRSGAGDTDLVIYALRKWVKLAIKGNPTVILPLYVPDEHVRHITDSGRRLRREIKHTLVSQSVRDRYVGYVSQQRDLLLGLRGGKHGGKRPELLDEYGFDTKFAYHMVRVAYQGLMLWMTGDLPVPIPEPLRSELVDLRHGKRTKEWAIETADNYLDAMMSSRSVLPPEPDMHLIHEWMWATYAEVWDG